MESFVYLLKCEARPRFKIGKAGDIMARALGLGHRFDPTLSIGLRVDSERAAYDLETILKKSFKRWRIDPDVIRAEDGHYRSGFTEWFSLDGWDRVRRFLVENAELLGFVIVDPLTEVFARPSARCAPKVSLRRSRSADPAADAAAFAACAARCLPLLNDLMSLCDKCEVIPTRYAGELRGTSREPDRLSDVLCDLMCESGYDVGWGSGRAFGGYHIVGRAHATFSLNCQFYWRGESEDDRFAPFRDAFLALPMHIDGWRECAGKVEVRDVFVVPRSRRRQ